MSRTTHIGLEQAETAVHGGGRERRARRRAELEEALALALALRDHEAVSELRAELDALRTPE